MSRLPSVILAVAIFAAALLAAPASAAMTTGTFVQRANTLRAQGFAALLSPDFQVLKKEARVAREQLKAESAARVRAGKRPIACVPEGQTIGIEEMIDRLAALPVAVKRQPLKVGYAQVLARRFPCR